MDDPITPDVDNKPRSPSLIVMALSASALVVALMAIGSTYGAVPGEVDDSAGAQPQRTLPPRATSTSTPPVSSDAARSTRIARSFVDDLDAVGASYGIAYATSSGIVVLDADGISEPPIEIAQEFAHASQFAMLTGDGRTWAIDADDRSQGYLVSNMFVVVDADRPGTVAIIDERSSTIGLLAAGLPVPGVDVPEGAELIAVQERGVLVLPRSGGTFEVSGEASSIVQVSDGRAVSASTSATIYERCFDDGSCSLSVETLENSAPSPLVVPPDSLVDVSPFGRWVLLRSPTQTAVINVVTGEITDLGTEPTYSVSWAPTGDFIALARDGKIDVHIPAESRSITLDTNESNALVALGTFVSSNS